MSEGAEHQDVTYDRACLAARQLNADIVIRYVETADPAPRRTVLNIFQDSISRTFDIPGRRLAEASGIDYGDLKGLGHKDGSDPRKHLRIAKALAEFLHRQRDQRRRAREYDFSDRPGGFPAARRTVSSPGPPRKETPAQWVYLSSRLVKSDMVEALISAIDEFIRTWQKSTFKFDPKYPLDQLQRDRLIQSCEAVIGMLRADVVERGFLAALSKRMKVTAAASTVFVAALGGAAGGAAGKAAETLLSSQGDDANANAKAAEALGTLLDQFVRQLPEKRCDGLPADEERKLDRLISKSRTI